MGKKVSGTGSKKTGSRCNRSTIKGRFDITKEASKHWKYGKGSGKPKPLPKTE
jgi:hypothetical protein